MSTATKKSSFQNKRVRSRAGARHAGKRQVPHLNEHLLMMYPNQSEEAGESTAQEAAEAAAGLP